MSEQPSEVRRCTGKEAELNGDAQIRIALQMMADKGGTAEMEDIYRAVEAKMNGALLSEQGKASLRNFINKTAVEAGYVYPHDKNNPGWHITDTGWHMTSKGREALHTLDVENEFALNLDTEETIKVPSNTARGAAFEEYIFDLMRKLYPYHTWYPQGQHKNNERGLDFIGNHLGSAECNFSSIGVQVKFHNPNIAPSKEEWVKFLAGCFTRSIKLAIFITTGKLTGEQRREAGEAKIIVIEGREEIKRVASLHDLEPFELFEEDKDSENITSE